MATVSIVYWRAYGSSQSAWFRGWHWSGAVLHSLHEPGDQSHKVTFPQVWLIDWLNEHGLTSAPTQYRLYGRRFLQVKRPNQQYQIFVWRTIHILFGLQLVPKVAQNFRMIRRVFHVQRNPTVFQAFHVHGQPVHMPSNGSFSLSNSDGAYNVDRLNPLTPTVAIWLQL